MIETLRHINVFLPETFGDTPIHIIGCGATGSKIAISIAKLGITTLHLWDDDVVESHNIANQAYSLNDIGKSKVDALSSIIKEHTGLIPICHNEKVKNQKLSGVIFVLTDTMASRKEIFENCIKLNLSVQLLIETRMGTDNGRVYSINPSNPSQVEDYLNTFYTDDIAETSACGARTSVGPTADVISGVAVWQFIRHHNIKTDRPSEFKDTLETEVIFGLKPLTIIINQ
jgi:molybdopterin/thiamine biosynthesis adenylyltransferase